MPCGATHKKISPITYGDNHSGGAWNAVVLAKERVKQESPKRKHHDAATACNLTPKTDDGTLARLRKPASRTPIL